MPFQIKQIENLEASLGVKTGRLSMGGPIKSITVETATDTIDITGLSLDTDGEYEISLSVVNDSGSTAAYSIYAGDPTIDDTATNYDSTRVVDGTSTANSSAIFGATDTTAGLSGRIRISKDPNDRFRVIAEVNQKAAPVNQQSMVRSSVTFGDITAIQLYANLAAGFGVGTQVRIYRLGGTLSTGTSISPLDIKRAADGFDDEFNETTLDSSWTVTNGAPGTVDFLGNGAGVSSDGIYDLITRRGWFLMQGNDDQTVFIQKAHGFSTGECAVAKFAVASAAGATSDVNGYLGLKILNAGNTGGIDFYAKETDSPQEFRIEVFSYGTEAGTAYEVPGVTPIGGEVYLQIVKEASGYSFWFSLGGTSWFHIADHTEVGSLPQIGIFTVTSDPIANNTPIHGVDWIRKGDGTALDPWPLVDGSTVQPVVTGEWRGALATVDTGYAATTATAIAWDNIEEDTDGLLDIGGSNPSRFTIPAGISRVRITCNLNISSLTGSYMVGVIAKNGTIGHPGLPRFETPVTDGNEFEGGSTSAEIPVVEGDYFELLPLFTGTGRVGDYPYTWMAIEVIEPVVAITDKGTVNISSSDSPYSMPPTKKTVYVTADGATTINLYELAGNNLQEVEVKIISGTSTVTLDGNSAETVEGSTTYAFSGAGQCRTFKAKSINGNLGWYLVSAAPGGDDPTTSTFTKSSGVHTYTPDQLQVSGTPDSDNDAANKKYVDDNAGGDPTDVFVSTTPRTMVVGTRYEYYDTTSTAIVANLPAIGAATRGKRFDVKLDVKPGSNNVTITPNGSDTIDGAASLVLSTVKTSYTLRCPSTGTDWKLH